MNDCKILDYYEELHCCALKSQCSIHTLSKLSLEPGVKRVLAGPLTGKVMCVGFKKTNDPLSEQLQFVGIPAGYIQFIALDSYNYLKTSETSKAAIGIAFAKLPKHRTAMANHFYFNIYYTDDPVKSVDLDVVARRITFNKLNFQPYTVTHAKLFGNDCRELGKGFLVSGSDEKIHLFTEVCIKECAEFKEVDIQKYFPEFSTLPGIVMSMHLKYLPELKSRLTAVGCLNGFVAIYVVDVCQKCVVKKFEFELSGPIASVRIFKAHSSKTKLCVSEWNLLVVGSYEPVAVFKNAFERGFVDICLLEESEDYDCVCCSLIADVDFDGYYEILLGTYGQKVLVYKLKSTIVDACEKDSSQNQPHQDSNLTSPRCKSATHLSETTDPFLPTSSSAASLPADDRSAGKARLPPASKGTTSDKGDDYVLVNQRNFSEPVMAMSYVRLNNGPLKELVVMTLNTVHILQVHTDVACAILMRKLLLMNAMKTGLTQSDTNPDSPKDKHSARALRRKDSDEDPVKRSICGRF